MTAVADPVDYHSIVDDRLGALGMRIVGITHDLMQIRLVEVMEFVNGIRREYSEEYGWAEETDEYFLNPLDRKFEFSFAIENAGTGELGFINFSSAYGPVIHNHCTYARKSLRGLDLAKYHMVKLCQAGLDAGFARQEGYWPIHNNGSIILFLKMGWQIEDIRKGGTQLFMTADMLTVRDRVCALLSKEGR